MEFSLGWRDENGVPQRITLRGISENVGRALASALKSVEGITEIDCYAITLKRKEEKL